MKSYFDTTMQQYYPVEPETVGECGYCELEIYEGEEVIEASNGQWFCDMDCFKNHLANNEHHKKITAERKCDLNE